MKFSQPNITDLEISAVTSALRNGDLATGRCVREFEDELRKKFGYEHVVACNSGTTALRLALEVLKIGPGDEVIVPAYGIMCTVNSILSVGATPVFGDVDRWSYALRADEVQKLITPKTKAVMPVSLFGVPCDVRAIKEVTDLPIVEDSIECLGSMRNGKYIGSDVDFATFGFYPNKQITTCQGGVVICKTKEHAEDIRALTQHGYRTGDGLWHPGFGHNVRLPDPLAAMGTAQLHRFWEMQDKLSQIARQYDQRFGQYRKQVRSPTDTHFVYAIELPERMYGRKHSFCMWMEELGVPVRPYFRDLTREPHVAAYERVCHVSRELGELTVAMPFHAQISSEDIELVCGAFKKVVGV